MGAKMSDYESLPESLETLMGLRSIIIASIDGHNSALATLRTLEYKHGTVKDHVRVVIKHIERIVKEDKEDLKDVEKRINAKQPTLF